jgi:glutamate-1-semialdehyde aminotransferase
LFPFLNIHNALLKIKKKELEEISKKTESLLKVLDAAAEKKETDKIVSVFAGLFRLQFKEKKVKEAQEWPIDVSFMSKLIVIGFIPILSRIIAALLIS